MEVIHNRYLAKCPKCDCNITISIGRVPGGVNDAGGWVLMCLACKERFSLAVNNPNDLSRVLSGAEVIDSWTDDIGDRLQVLANHSLSNEFGNVDLLMVKEIGEPDHSLYDLSNHALYCCSSCKEPIDTVAYEALGERIGAVNSALGSYLIYFLGSHEHRPYGLSVRIKCKCKCGTEHSVRFFKKFSEACPTDAEEFWLIAAEGTASTIDIDGVYSRDDCIAILEKLLLRWQATHNLILLAAPFIGFNFPTSRKRIPDLWNWVMKYTDPGRTAIITRKATFNLLKDASKDTDMDVEFLKSWGLLNPMLEALDKKRAFFKTDFHAKFYCGMSADHVEILVGSFNIHEGSYVENIHLLRYELTDFTKRYLLGMRMFFDTALLKRKRALLEINVCDERIPSSNIVWYEASLDSSAIN